MGLEQGVRSIEAGVRTDLAETMAYGDYLHLDVLLSAQEPRSDPPHHDEMLFIVQHQIAELWFKLVLHELLAARRLFDADDSSRARKSVARVKHVLRTMTDQWSVLATLTPSEYAQFRGVLGSASGFQSYQYRAVEFILGNKNEQMLQLFAADPPSRAGLADLLESPTVYDAFLRLLSRRGHAVAPALIERDVRLAWVQQPTLIPVFQRIYSDPDAHWEEYACCEDLVDLEDAFQLWRFRHLRTVQRTIGFKTGTGGSSGVEFLRRALDLTFFPELFSVRTEIGA